jgi:hypothetical protein
MIVFGLLEVAFLGVMIMPFFADGSSPQDSLSPLFIMGICAFPIWWAIGLLKSARAQTAVLTDGRVSDPDKIITINGTITLSDYRRTLFVLTYTRPVFIYVHFIGIVMLAGFISKGDWDWYTIFLCIMLLYMPIAVYRAASRQYNSAKMLREKITYTFTTENFICEGESFNTTMKWDGFHKTKETKRFFMLYTNSTVATFIPKHAFNSEADLSWFRERIRTIG